MNRRRFLQSLGLTGAGIGVGAGLGALASAAEGEAPKRLLIISHCHGWPYDYWKMRPNGVDENTPWELDLASMSREEFSPVLAPLFDIRRRMINIDGLSLATAELDSDGNRHDTGWVHAWTGDNANFSGTTTGSSGQSLDQMVADSVSRSDRLPSLELSINGNNEPGRPIAYSGNGVQLPVLDTAELAWSRLFGPSSGDATLAARQRDVLSFADAEYRAARSSLGQLAKRRLDAHFELLVGLGDRIEGMAALQCEAPQTPSNLANYDDTFDAYSDLIAAAFGCDITRVVSLSLGEMPTSDFGADDITDDVHKGLAHEIYNDPAKYLAMADYLTHHASQVARLVALLEATPDIDGRSVMDNTLIVWGSELGNGWHGYQTYCPTIIGGDWHFRTGRYLHLPHETPIEMMVPEEIASGGYSEFSGRPHQHLLVSTAQAMGLPVDHVGIDLAMGQRGDHVDCSGPLEELT